MLEKNNSNEHLFYLGIFLLALLVRIINLGSIPLSDFEAATAFEALSIARLQPIAVGTQASYVGLTAITFFLFEATTFFARIWPALVGSLIIFVPYLWQKRFGYWQSIILAVMLAIDPIMLAASRQAGSPIFGVVGLILGLSLFLKRNLIWAGICLAIGVLGGESFWMGIAILSLTMVILHFLKHTIQIGNTLLSRDYWKFFVSFVLSLLIIGSGFGLYPAGLSGIMSGLVSFIHRFTETSDLSYWQPFAALLIYEFLPLVLGVWAALITWRGIDQQNRLCIVGALVGLLLTILMPGRIIVDLVWVIMPLWVMAVKLLLAKLVLPTEQKMPSYILSLFTIIMLGYLLMNLRSLADPNLLAANATGNLIALGAGILLLSLSLILIGLGWQFHLALRSFFIGSCIFFFMIMLSASLSTVTKTVDGDYELWQLGKRLSSSSLAVEIIENLVKQSSIPYMDARVAVINQDEKEFGWALRTISRVQFYKQLPSDQQPEFVLTTLENIPQLAVNYRGEALDWHRSPDWKEMTLVEHLRYFINREVTLQKKEIILWVRADLFPGGSIID